MKEGDNVDFTSLGNVNGLLSEPVNPSLTLSNRMTMDEDARKAILGKFEHEELLDENHLY